MGNCGLILEGGANRGIFTAGVLDYFQQKDINISYVAAVSVSSNNAIDYVSKQVGRTKSCLIPQGRNIPPVHWMNIFSAKSIVNLDLAFNKYPNELVPFDYDTFFSSNVLLEIVVTNCFTGQPEYLTEKKDRKRLMSICMASCSMPYLCAPIPLDGNLYLDGGIADAIPIERSIEMGNSKNIIILTRDINYTKKKFKYIRYINKAMYKKYPNLIEKLDTRIDRYDKTLCLINKMQKSHEVIVIRPSKVLVSRTDNNYLRMNKFYDQGYQIAKENCNEIQKFISS
jgi:predicted patatin/cPLA2 family phospholipase